MNSQLNKMQKIIYSLNEGIHSPYTENNIGQAYRKLKLNYYVREWYRPNYKKTT